MSETGSRWRKVACTHCECTLRMSRAAMLRHGLPTCGCGMEMMPDSIEDAILLGDEVLSGHPDYVNVRDIEARRAIRDGRRGVAGKRMQCGGCSAFIAAPNTHCGCGFSNAIRGNRNEGTYAGVPRRADAIPF